MTNNGGIRACCIECEGEVILVEEGGSLEALGYGYGTFVCQECGARSSYYGEGLKTIAPDSTTVSREELLYFIQEHELIELVIFLKSRGVVVVK